MTRTRWTALACISLSCVLSALWGLSAFRTSSNLMIDFKGVYYHARCLLQHGDPYKPGETLKVYLAEGGILPQFPEGPRQVLTLDLYLPTAFIFVAPFAMFPWGTAQVLWTILGIGCFIFAAFLMWDLGSNYAPVVSGCLICFVLANTEAFFPFGNPAAIAISLCLVAVWCFLKNRFIWAGILCLAISLAIKPNDAGLVWLYFLLAGGLNRKRALQILLVTAVLGLAAIAWVTPIAPHWMQELHSNLLAASAHGGISDPGPANANNVRGPGMIICLQSAVAIFRDAPRVYSAVSYLVCVPPLLIWAIRTLRSRFSQTNAWLALAAIAPLTILAAYHRLYDTKLLLLAVPACAMLWARGGSIRWLALLVTSAGFVFTGDMSLTILRIVTNNLHISTTKLSGQILTVVLMRPTELVLLLMSIFYLWVYLRREPEKD